MVISEKTSMAGLALRRGRPEDAPICGRICHDAFKAIAERHGFAPDFASVDAATGLMAFVLGKSNVYSVVAELEGRIVGSNFLWEGPVAGVGPITVDPTVQNAAIGGQMMQDVMDYSERKGFAGVRLVQAGYHSRSLSLYAKLGFVVREPLVTMQGAAVGEKVPGCEVRLAVEKDVEGCNALCLSVHGHTRAMEVLDAIRQRTATVAIRNGRITGYATVVGFFGHAVGETNEDLKALIAAAPAYVGPGFLVPTRNAGLFRWCLDRGLRIVQPMTLMSAGLYNEPAGPFLPSILY